MRVCLKQAVIAVLFYVVLQIDFFALEDFLVLDCPLISLLVQRLFCLQYEASCGLQNMDKRNCWLLHCSANELCFCSLVCVCIDVWIDVCMSGCINRSIDICRYTCAHSVEIYACIILFKFQLTKSSDLYLQINCFCLHIRLP